MYQWLVIRLYMYVPVASDKVVHVCTVASDKVVHVCTSG